MFVKEESFAINYPTSGKHLDIKGYGDRDYSAYMKKRQVKFSFDTYQGKDYQGQYIPAYTWVDFPEGVIEQKFFIPSWSEENREHEVYFRTIPLNLRDDKDQNIEMHANLDRKNYKAVEKITVSVFGTFEKIQVLSAKENHENANATLPIYPKTGKVKSRLDGVRLGFPVDFLIQTNAGLFQRNDMIKVVPYYYFVDKNGKKTEVDLYYASNSKLQKINVENTVIEQRARLKDWSALIGEERFHSTAKVLVSQKRSNGLDFEGYQKALLGERYIPLGDNSELMIGERLKVYHGIDLAKEITKPKEVAQEEIEKSKQSWYLRFFLPNETYVVPKGTDFKKLVGVRLNETPFLHNGFILVKLEWQIYKDGNKFMTYYTEAQGTSSIVYQAGLGDSIFYDSERRASHLLN